MNTRTAAQGGPNAGLYAPDERDARRIVDDLRAPHPPGKLYLAYLESERRHAAAEQERNALGIPDPEEMARLMRHAKPRPGDTMEAFYRDLAEIETLHKTLFRTDQARRYRGEPIPAQLARAWRRIDALYTCDMGTRYAAILAAEAQPALLEAQP